MCAVLLVISENPGQTDDGALNTQITPIPGSLPASSLILFCVQIPAVGISSQGQSPTGTRCHWHFLLNKSMELWEGWEQKSHLEGRVGKRKKKKLGFFPLEKKNLRRNDLLPQRKGKGKEIADFWLEYTRGTVGKIWHTETLNFYIS